MVKNFMFGFKYEDKYKMTLRHIDNIDVNIIKEIEKIIKKLQKLINKFDKKYKWPNTGMEKWFNSIEVVQDRYKKIKDFDKSLSLQFEIDSKLSSELQEKNYLRYLDLNNPLKEIYDEYEEVYYAPGGGYGYDLKWIVLININIKDIEIYKKSSFRENNRLGKFKKETEDKIIKKYNIAKNWSVFNSDSDYKVFYENIVYNNDYIMEIWKERVINKFKTTRTLF